jgi:glycosyltransferase involved in cell wall biosynthesis
MDRIVKLAHIWSSDMGVSLSLPHVERFLARGWRVYALCPDGPRLDVVRKAGVIWLPMPLSRRLVDPVGDVRSTATIVRACRSERFDLVHTHNIKAGLIGRVAAGLARAPRIVHTMHGMPFDRETRAPKRIAHAALEWTASRFADRVLVQSDEDRATLLAHHTIDPSRIVKIGNGIRLDRFSPPLTRRDETRRRLGVRDDEVVFFSAGRLVREKGFVELGEAAARAQAVDPRIRVFVIGPRDVEKGDCLTDAELAALRGAGVDVLGERPAADMPDLYAASDVVTLLSWREGLPRVLMEGAAMGKALLASDVRGCREVVVVPDGGLLVPARDPARLAEAMIELARDPARRAAAGAFNRARAACEYDVARVVDRIERVYEELLAS